jgi:hypothetical protein
VAQYQGAKKVNKEVLGGYKLRYEKPRVRKHTIFDRNTVNKNGLGCNVYNKLNDSTRHIIQRIKDTYRDIMDTKWLD